MLETFFKPDGVVVIGASRDPRKLGHGVVRNLIDYHYHGAIYPVNPRASEILGLACYDSLEEVPDPVDLAVVVVPASAVPETLRQCGERRIKHAIVVSGGFSETGKEGRELEQALVDVAREYDIRVIGPNCIGTIDTHTPVNTTFVTGMPEPGEIGFSSQSGAMVAAVIDWARGAGVGFSRIVSLGNQVDVNETQMIETVCRDPQTRVITAYIEGVSNGRAFMEKASEAASEKPFVVLKGGHGEGGRQAVASHTGALAGRFEVYRAAFKRCGVQQAESMEEMFDWARALAWQPLPEGNRVAVLTNAGGPAILAVDALEEAGLEMAPLSESTREYLASRLPRAASTGNPVDVLAGSGPGTYAVALDALLSDETVDAVVVIQAPQDWFLPASLAEVVGEVTGVHKKPVVTSIMGKASVDEALNILHQRKVPNVAFPERTASVLSAMLERKRWLLESNEEPAVFEDVNREIASAAVEKSDWQGVLEAYGISFPLQCGVDTLQEAKNAAESIGYPVVLKLVTEEVTHKTEVGGVKTDLRDPGALADAWEELEETVRIKDLTVETILVQKMLAGGQEVIIGIRRDEQFGPTILFGSGGVDVELLKDVEIDLVPLNRSRAGKLVDATRAGVKMQGWRKQSPTDRLAVLEYLQRISQLAEELPEISELEINPLYVLPGSGGAFALDVRGARVNQMKLVKSND